ncbi:hypothetical protein B0T14DRAFT_334170 [Immersiella caudata]|uniref:Uncharacterized protein n=1 Tax=Immersiella caudata TaxID=314043 RepID=A0AA39WB79_9PEZI|nr:hypothetical protein B0T14DRAFT_334170 [Immersiella caudata]
MAAIRALIVAMAKQNGIQVPAEALPARPSIGPAGTRLKGLHDGAKTIDYQLQQCPTVRKCPSPEWDQIFDPFPVAELAVAWRDRPLNKGWVGVHSWTVPQDVDLHGAYVSYEETGYDDDGYICNLRKTDKSAEDVVDKSRLGASSLAAAGREIDEHILMQSPGDTSLAGQRFGRDWRFGLNGLSDGSLFSIAAAQFCRNADLDLDETGRPNQLGSARQRLAKCFLTQFRGTWEPSLGLWGKSDHRWTGSMDFDKSSWEDVVFQYHMRVFTTLPPQRDWGKPLGENIKRVRGTLMDEKNGRSLELFEIRFSVGLKTTWRLDFPIFSLVTMADAAAGGLQDCPSLWAKHEWGSTGIHPSLRATGVAAFAFRIRSLLPRWEAHWSRLIDSIGKLLNADLSNMLSKDHRREIMVDTSDLKLSDFYFAVIQILRIAAEWIQESMDHLRHTVDDMERLYLATTSDPQFASFLPASADSRDVMLIVFKQNWESVMQEQRQIGNALLGRVAKKMEETKSLRDGLFNATSVNEATKSTQLNQYILVFTLATVFYLPLSFIAAVFALGSFDWQDGWQTTWFIVAIILVAGATYSISWLSIWAVGDPARRQKLTDVYARLDRRIFSRTEPGLPGA